MKIPIRTYSRKRNKNRNAGFTLVEMIVVMLVLSILLAVTANGLITWQDWANYNRQNEYAHSLFLAAQNQLTQYTSDGQMEAIQDLYVKTNGQFKDTVDLSKLTAENGEKYKSSYETGSDGQAVVWCASDTYKSDKYSTAICYAMCERGDYKKYQDGQTISDSAKVVFSLLEAYVFDPSILNNAICIEFTPQEGQVFSVCFSDMNKQFTYDDSQEGEGVVSICNRQGTVREEKMIGYYGVDTLSKSISSEKEAATIKEIKLNNEDTLNLSYKLGTGLSDETNMKYSIMVSDVDAQAGKGQVLSFTLPGSSLHNYDYRTTISCPVTRYLYKDDGTCEKQAIGDYNILAWIDSDKFIRVVLDAADLQATSTKYMAGLKETGNSGLKGEKAGDNAFADTLSFHRFGLHAENIFCTVQASGVSYETSLKKQSNSSAVYFDKSIFEKKGNAGSQLNYEYEIANARHLYNIRYNEDLTSDLISKVEDASTFGSTVKRDYKVTVNVDWQSFLKNESLYNSKTVTGAIADTAFANYEGTSAKTESPLQKANTTPEQDSTAGKTAAVTWAIKADFPSIDKLTYGNSFCADRNKVIAGLSITEQTNAASSITVPAVVQAGGATADNQKPEMATGLFVQNFGTITDATLDNITVEGKKKVGAFCGINSGTLATLTTKNSNEQSCIAGEEYIGGIYGYQAGGIDDSDVTGATETKQITLKSLDNYAEVKGTKYVGGIVGEIHVPKDSKVNVSIRECDNFGAMTAVNPKDENGIEKEGKTLARYLGGIVGYCNNETGLTTNLSIQKCNSSPQYSDQKLEEVLSKVTDAKAESLNGVYVGGIAGYNNGGDISDCNTKANGGKKGYIIGYQYVGGIVGYNQGTAGSITGGEGDNTSAGVNEAYVLGDRYVGGITGCNADIKETDSTNQEDVILEPDQTRSPKLKISNWTNKGLVYAKSYFAGGITGYNTGWIFECKSNVDSTIATSFFKDHYSGDYAGGITGYNNGIIGNTKRDETGKKVAQTDDTTPKTIQEICYISGNNYVGGIVGFNDKDAIVENYELKGGYVLGKGCYIGGYAGCNVSLSLLMDRENKDAPQSVVSSPNKIEGKYFVGISIGANIVDPYKSPIKTIYAADNFLGEVKADAFVGGFVGYNLLLDTDNNEKQPYYVSQYLIKQMNAAGTGKDDTDLTEAQKKENAYKDKIAVLDDLKNVEKFDIAQSNGKTETVKAFAIKKADSTITITGSDSHNFQSKLGNIEGDIYVGGVVGYNDDATYLTISDLQNKTNITANISVPYDKSTNRKDYNGQSFTYSYGGGIIGKVSKHTVVDNCKNALIAKIDTAGTFHGGLCEINEGTVIRCATQNTSNSTKDYVGGLCGINLPTGSIKDCTITPNEDETKIYVYGKNYTGGIVSYNIGTVSMAEKSVQSVEMNGKDAVGVIAAYNEGSITLSDELKNLNVKATGECVGAVVGIQADAKKEISVASEITGSSATKHITISGRINGNRNVGGVIGKNSSAASIRYFDNNALIQAEQGNAGGIIGINSGKGSIVSCENKALVRASKGGYAGGITSENEGEIKYCYDFAKVESANGSVGGITTKNSKTGVITSCHVQPVEDTKLADNAKLGENQKILVLASKNNVGGIVAENHGKIKSPTVKYVTVQNYTDSDASEIGLVAGNNAGEITFAIGTDNIEAGSALTYTNDSSVGGVAGRNSGTILGQTGTASTGATPRPLSVVKCSVGYANSSPSIANLGGAAGANTGTIKNCFVKADITGKFGSSTTGIGGICGYSGNLSTVETKQSEITNCYFDGMVYGPGSADNLLYIGGITGCNSYNSTITDCQVGVDETTEITGGNSNSAFTYIAGIAGDNKGTIKNCDNSSDSNKTVTITGYCGMVGGIVGYNHEEGLVTGTDENHLLATGKNWKLIENYYSNDCGVGGIIGYSCSGEDIQYVDNHASVMVKDASADNTTAGGFIGRCENKTTVAMSVTNCNNYGRIGVDANDKAIKSSARAAGFFGTLKNHGARITDCSNFGEIYGRRCVSGFVANAYGIGDSGSTTDYLYIENCTNYGALVSSDAVGGMLSSNADNGNGLAYFVKCINVGVVQSSNQNAVAGGIAAVNKDNAIFTMCQNYGAVTRGTNSFGGGIGPSINGGKSVFTNCLNVGSTNYPIGKDKNNLSSNNYYIDKTSDDVENVEDQDYYFSLAQPSNSDQKNGLFNTLGTQDQRTNWTYNNTKTCDITINVNGDEGMRYFYIMWCNNNGTSTNERDYLSDIYFYNAKGETLYSVQGTVGLGRNSMEDSLQTIAIPDGVDLTGLSNITIKTKETKEKSTYIVIRAFNWAGADGVRKPCNAKKANVFVDLNYTGVDNNKLTVVAETAGTYSIDQSDVKNLTYNPAANEFDKDQSDDTKYIEYMKDASDVNMQAMGYRWKVYEELHPKILKLIQSAYRVNEKLPKPQNLNITSQNGFYHFTWQKVAKAYEYEVYCSWTDVDGEKQSEKIRVQSTTFYDFPFEDEWNGKELTFHVRAVSGNEAMKDEDGEAFSSDWSDKTQKALYALEMPKAHLEMVDATHMVAILDNQDDYKIAEGEQDLDQDGYKDCVIEVNVNNNIFTISPKDGYSKTWKVITNTNWNTNYNVIATAKTKDSKNPVYAESNRQIISSVVLTGKDFTSTTQYYNTTTFDGFKGDTAESLLYQLRLKSTSDYYIDADFSAYDEDLKTTISYSHAKDSHATKYESVVQLNRLPEDMMEKEELTVWTYIWATQGYAIYYGHNVGENLTKEQLLTLRDTQKYVADGTNCVISEDTIWASKSETGNTLKPGYVIYKNADDTYNVIYSVLLANKTETVPYGVYEKKYTKNASDTGYSYTDAKGVEKTLPIQPKPEISDTFVDQSDSESDVRKYTFYWDQAHETENAYKNAKYSLKLTGQTADGKTVTLQTVNEVTMSEIKNNQGYTFEYEDPNWKYASLTVYVSRKGEIDNAGNTTLLASTSDKLIKVKLKLTKPVIASFVKTKDSTGAINKNNLEYEITWSANHETSELSDLAGYLIKVAPKDATSGSATKYYYYEKNTGLTVSLPDEAHTTAIHPQVNADGTYKAVLDLESFQGKETAVVTVQAIARNAEEADYESSSLSESVEQEIPERMTVPDISKMTAIMKSDETALADDTTASIQATILEDGIQFTMPQLATGNYQLALAVFDQKDDNENGIVEHTGDGGAKESGYWNSSSTKAKCVKTLIGKESASAGQMTQNYIYKFTSDKESWKDYAGYWVKAAIRSKAQNQISSNWSDEDGDGLTTNYKWFYIPMIQIEDVNLKADTATRYVDMTNYEVLDDSEYSESQYQLQARTVSFEQPEYAQGIVCQITIPNEEEDTTASGDATSGTEEPGDTTEEDSTLQIPLYIEKEEIKDKVVYHVFYGTMTEDEIEAQKDSKDPVCNADEKAKYMGDLSTDKEPLTMNLPFEKTYKVTAFHNQNITCTTTLTLQNKDDQDSFLVVLPDIAKISTDGGNSFNKDSSLENAVVGVRVQAVSYPDENKPKQYKESAVTEWIWNETKNQYVIQQAED